ncbi:uncharacterized protein LOC132609299 [Lycium barbarum]|uniref:uncharacterized protein LOC132609299 n=1 Tax=Lycium barbarum TaxID=112863 RepID=UPI00293E9855|nr:uncharacterized protein LOC132609299 [Lycium barbarum]
MRNATSKVKAEYITDLVHHTLQEITPKFVIEEMRSRYGLHIGYHKAWRSLQHAYNVIRGSPENNYRLLPQYLHMMKLRNPGTVANIKWTADNKFKYAFFAHGASIEGWKHCRPVMMVDATFLKSKYRGVLMIAVAKDGNNCIFPLAFGIADSENNESYRWFFRHVKKVFGTRKYLSILSDRHSSIATAIKELYPDTQHGICIYHMEKNLQKYFPSEAILSLFYNAATTYKQAEFLTYMSQIQEIDPKSAEYIEEEPPERWAHEGYQYNVDLKNMTCECLEFQTDELPCTHAMAVIDKRSLPKSTYCADWFKKQACHETYKGEILSVGNQDSCIIPQNIMDIKITPPDVKIRPGRKQTKRYRPRRESTKYTYRCGRCKFFGHTRATCNHSPALNSYSRRYRKRKLSS